MTNNPVEICEQLLKSYSDEREIIKRGLDGDIYNSYLKVIEAKEESISAIKQDLNHLLNNYLSE